MSYKISSITTLINRTFALTFFYALLHKELEYLRNYFTQNAYPLKLLHNTLKKYLNKKFVKLDDTHHYVTRKIVT